LFYNALDYFVLRSLGQVKTDFLTQSYNFVIEVEIGFMCE